MLASAQIRDDLLQLIRHKRPGDRLPSDRELTRAYKVAYATVQKTMQALAEEGLIERHVGRGSFVGEQARALRELAVWTLPGQEQHSYFGGVQAEWLRSAAEAAGVPIRLAHAPLEMYAPGRDELWRDSAFDVIVLDNLSRYREYSTKRLFLPLNRPLADAGVDLFGTYTAGHLRHFSVNGEVDAVCTWYLPYVLAYNKCAFAKLGMPCPEGLDWAGLLAVCREIRARQTPATGRIDPFYFTVMTYRIMAFIWQNGGEIMADGRCVLDSPETAGAMQFVLDLLDANPHIPPALGHNLEYCFLDLLAEGRLAMMMISPHHLTRLEQAGVLPEIGVTHLPVGRCRATQVFERSFAVRAGCRKPRTAARLLGGLLGEAVQRRIGRESFLVPVNPACRATEDPVKRVFAECVDYGRFAPEIADGTLNDRLNEYLTPIFTRQRPIREVLADTQQRINRVIEETRP